MVVDNLGRLETVESKVDQASVRATRGTGDGREQCDRGGGQLGCVEEAFDGLPTVEEGESCNEQACQPSQKVWSLIQVNIKCCLKKIKKECGGQETEDRRQGERTQERGDGRQETGEVRWETETGEGSLTSYPKNAALIIY